MYDFVFLITIPPSVCRTCFSSCLLNMCAVRLQPRLKTKQNKEQTLIRERTLSAGLNLWSDMLGDHAEAPAAPQILSHCDPRFPTIRQLSQSILGEIIVSLGPCALAVTCMRSDS